MLGVFFVESLDPNAEVVESEVDLADSRGWKAITAHRKTHDKHIFLTIRIRTGYKGTYPRSSLDSAGFYR